MKTTNLLALVVASLLFTAAAQANIVIPAVPVGNPGNANDTRYIDGSHPSGAGSVGSAYDIGQTEVTNTQYVAFLNAVAAADPYGLYSTSMGSDTRGGIVRGGSSGSYTYAVKASALSGSYAYGDKPVVYVSWGDAARFANWLHNDQGSGSTETGAYTLNGATSNAALAAVTREPGAKWFLPSENEWYKAAYYDPNAATYYDYPTGSNSLPNNNLPASDTGNSANSYYYSGYTTGNVSYPLTDAGAYTLSDSPYGTLDQGGNVWEWNETLLSLAFRGYRGGSWNSNSINLRALYSYFDYPSSEGYHLGFRVASIPEPSSLMFLGLGFLVVLGTRKWVGV